MTEKTYVVYFDPQDCNFEGGLQQAGYVRYDTATKRPETVARPTMATKFTGLVADFHALTLRWSYEGAKTEAIDLKAGGTFAHPKTPACA